MDHYDSLIFFFSVVDGGFSDWSDWSDCSASCGDGDSSRTRECNNPKPAGTGKKCVGETKETKKCNKGACKGIVLPYIATLNLIFLSKKDLSYISGCVK